MGNIIGQVFHPISITLQSHNSNKPVPEETKKHIRVIFDALRANPRVTPVRLEPDGSRNEFSRLLSKIPKNDNILAVLDSEGYNLLQKTVGNNNIYMVRWILGRSPDLNRGACSLPLHIACLRGFEELVQLLLKNGARTDAEGRMCWPQPHHNPNCVERGKHNGHNEDSNLDPHSSRQPHSHNQFRCSDKLQNSIYYAIDGDQPAILDILTQRGDDKEGTWLSWSQKRPPLLHIACERGAWNCVQYLVNERADEINYCFDEYFPIHFAVMHDVKFTAHLLQCGASAVVRTATQQLTCLHVLFLLSKKSAEDVLVTTKLLLEHGLKDLINEADSLGNTPLHALIVRYALEESRVGMYQDYIPWSKWDMMHLVLFLLQQGARPSINQPGNSALAGVLRHVRDWEFRYELLSMLLAEGGNPNVVGRDGSVPLMVCLVPLINKDLLHNFTHSMKVFYLNCVRTLLKHGANPNCSSRTNLTPLHIIMFAAGEYMGLTQSEEKDSNFAFLRQLLVVLLQFGLDPNVRFSSRTQHILLSLLEMVMSARMPEDLDYVYDLTLTLIQYGANPNVNICHAEPMIIQSQSSFFLKKSSNKILYYYIQWLCSREHLLLDPHRRFARIIYLYVMCMDHRELYNCIKLVYTQSAIVPVRTALCTTLKAIHTTPRSLRQQARYVIYKRLVRKPGLLPLQLQKLPVPSPVLKYLLNFE